MMTKLWQYIAKAHATHEEAWGWDYGMRDTPSLKPLHEQFPRPNWFGRLSRFLVALGFLRGKEGDLFANLRWHWAFWDQERTDKVMGDRGWRHYHLPWSHPFRKARRRAGFRVLVTGR